MLGTESLVLGMGSIMRRIPERVPVLLSICSFVLAGFIGGRLLVQETAVAAGGGGNSSDSARTGREN